MANASLVTVNLDMAASDIAGARQRLTEAKRAIVAVIAALDGIPTKYADMIATVSAVGYGQDAFTNSNVAQLAALSAEYNALNAQAKIVNTWLAGNTTEF
jgi:hypothetical protein